MPHKVVVSSTTKELYDIIAPLCDNGFPVWHFTTNRFQTITFEKKNHSGATNKKIIMGAVWKFTAKLWVSIANLLSVL